MINTLSKVNQISYSKWCKLPAQRLCYFVADTLQNNPKIMDILRGDIALYNRDDWESRQVPGLSIYYKRIGHKSSFWFREGTVYLKYVNPLEVARDRLHEITAVLSDATDNIFSSMDTFYALEAEIPGLRAFGYSTEWDASRSEAFGQDNMLALVGEYEFSIDYLIWRQYIEDTIGADPLDPCTQIYQAVTGFELFVAPPEFLT